MNLWNKINELKENYDSSSPEHELLKEIRFWMKDVVRGCLIESNLDLAMACINCYENTKNYNENLVDSLKEIIIGGYKLIKK